MRRQSEEILEKLNWYLGEKSTKAETKTLEKYHKYLKINTTNYKEIKHGKKVNEHKEKITDKSENENNLELEQECDTFIETKNDKEHEYDVELEQENDILTEDRETNIEQETKEKNGEIDSGNTTREIAQDKTDNINKTFSIRCTLKKHYDQLAEICKKS